MDLILIRHGTAEDFNHQGDGARELIGKGYQQAKLQAQRLLQANQLPDVVLTSPLTRAQQTALTFCQSADLPAPLIQPWLAAGMHPELAIRELAGFQNFKRVAIVGHEPDFSDFIESLLGVSCGAIEIKKGSIACIKIQPPAKKGILKYLIPAKIS